MFGKKTIAIDGAKIRAQNSKKNNFSDKSIKRHQAYLDKRTKEYLSLLEQNDQQGKELISKNEISEKLEQLSERKKHYNNLQAQLDKAKEKGEKQISTIDRDARLFTSIGSKGEIAFNLQSAVDDKHKLIVHNQVTNKVDTNALYEVASEAKRQLQAGKIDVLADTGYDTGEELKKCAEDNITTFVAPRSQRASSKNSEFAKDKFKYDKQTDSYTCPTGQILKTNKKAYTKVRKEREDAPFKEYKQKYTICNNCIYKDDWCVSQIAQLCSRRNNFFDQVPSPTMFVATQVGDGLGALDGPFLARELEPLLNDTSMGCFYWPRTNH